MESFLIFIVGFVKIQIFTLLPCYFHLPFTLPTQINFQDSLASLGAGRGAYIRWGIDTRH